MSVVCFGVSGEFFISGSDTSATEANRHPEVSSIAGWLISARSSITCAIEPAIVHEARKTVSKRRSTRRIEPAPIIETVGWKEEVGTVCYPPTWTNPSQIGRASCRERVCQYV